MRLVRTRGWSGSIGGRGGAEPTNARARKRDVESSSLSLLAFAASLGPASMRKQLAHLSDEALVALMARGDETALGELYDRVGRIAYGLAVRILRDDRWPRTQCRKGS